MAYSTPVFNGSAGSIGCSTELCGSYHLIHSQARGGDTLFDITTSQYEEGVGK